MLANAFDLEALKVQLAKPASAEAAAQFKTELGQVLAGEGVDRHEFERLTDLDFDTEGDYLNLLGGAWAFLYEGAPLP